MTVFASEASVADALATSIANSARGPDERSVVESALERADDFREALPGGYGCGWERHGDCWKDP